MSLQKETGLWKALGFGVGPVGMGMGHGLWVMGRACGQGQLCRGGARQVSCAGHAHMLLPATWVRSRVGVESGLCSHVIFLFTPMSVTQYRGIRVWVMGHGLWVRATVRVRVTGFRFDDTVTWPHLFAPCEPARLERGAVEATDLRGRVTVTLRLGFRATWVVVRSPS